MVKSGILLFAFLAAVASPIAASGQEPPAASASGPIGGWREATLDELGAKVLMSGSPEIKAESHLEGDRTVRVVMASATSVGCLTTVARMDLRQDGPLDEEQQQAILDHVIDSGVRAVQASEISPRRSVTLGKFPGRESVAKDKNGTVVVYTRVYLVPEYLYVVSIGLPGPGGDDQLARQFFDSFQLQAKK